MDPGHLPSECTVPIDNFSFWLSVGTIFGVVFSTLPFFYKIYQRKSSLGISPYFLILSVLASICTTGNIYCLQRVLLSCCRFQAPGTCFSNLLGILTVTAQLILSITGYFLFIYYYPSSHKYRDTQPYILRQEWKHTVISLYACGIVSLIVLFVSWFLLALQPEYIPSSRGYSGGIWGWATFLGVISTIFSLFQYVPQLYKTWRSKRIGSLSVPALIIQTPGSFLVCYSIMIRPASNVTTWIGMLVSASLQALLLGICLRLYYLKQKALKSRRSPGEIFDNTPMNELGPLSGNNSSMKHPLISSDIGLNTDPIEIELSLPEQERGFEYRVLHPLYDNNVLSTSKTVVYTEEELR
jgi:uncharacterized protein with PQ loop repeat